MTQPLDHNYSLFNTPQSRYSPGHDTTARQNGKDYLIEIPWFAREDEFKPVDVQGRKAQGTDYEQTVTDLYTEYTGNIRLPVFVPVNLTWPSLRGCDRETGYLMLCRCNFSAHTHTDFLGVSVRFPSPAPDFLILSFPN